MSETTAHTPGPWLYASGMIWKEGNPDGREYPEDNPRTYPIARCDRETPETSPCERDANARLIAAAPALFEALQRIADSKPRESRRGRGFVCIKDVERMQHTAKTAIAQVTSTDNPTN